MEAIENAMGGQVTSPPEEFQFSAGGFNSPSFRVEFDGNTLLYYASYVGLRNEEFVDGLDRDTWDFLQRALDSDNESVLTTALSLIESRVKPLRRPEYYSRFGFEPATTPFQPIEPDWAELRAALDQIGVWEWQDHYVNLDVLGGTGWSLRIRWGDKSIRSGGANAFPEDAAGNGSPFEALIAPIRHQIGGRALY